MSRYFQIFTFFLGMFLSAVQVSAQIYEYTPLAVGCSGVWQDGDCWNKTPLNEPVGCADNGLWPPFDPSGCKVEVIINDDLEISGDVEFGGNFTSLTVGNAASLTFSDNLSIEGRRNMLFYLDGESFINVTGALTISQGGTSTQTVLNLGGDGLGMMTVSSIIIENRAVLEVLEGGAITSEGPTEYSGNSSKINVTGFFRTQSLLVTGGRLHQFNTYGNSQVVIDGDMDVRGDTEIAIGGTSEVYVDGNINVDGDAQVIAEDDSKIFVCGTYPPPSVGGQTQEIDDGKFFPCSVLPVELLDQRAEYYEGLRKVRLSWATGKEEDLRHFIIERAIGSIAHFEPFGKVEGVGGTTEPGIYEFWDENLPLFTSRIYYRLLLVDVSGEQKRIGDVLVLAVPGTNSESEAWVFFPNPNRGGEATISIANQEMYNGEPISLTILGSFGLAASLKSSDLGNLNRELVEKMKRLPTGVYFFTIQWGDQKQILKILKK